MGGLKSLLLAGAVLLTAACGFTTAKSGENEGNSKKSAKGGEVLVLNKAEFLAKVFNYEKNRGNWVYEGSKPCIVDFYADWCPPCKKIAPVMKELAAEYKDDIVIYKINVDEEEELAAVFGIKSIPSLLFIPAKGQPQMAAGALPKEEFVRQINAFLLGK
ncbi:Thioredoxin C-1 [Bacteroidales bacterium Barb4]|nr:Thioredoxin C-1 [Bacteroidales bacterium Barb4]